MAKKKMARYVCEICGYIYSPERGEPKNGIMPGTAFDDLPSSYVCPVCGARAKVGKTAFSKMEEVYYYLADSYYLWGQAEKSVPFFTKVISDYPQSKLAKKAQERLNEINARPKEKK